MSSDSELEELDVPGPCPECRSGKHRNCNGQAWDYWRDEPAPCPCEKAGHW